MRLQGIGQYNLSNLKLKRLDILLFLILGLLLPIRSNASLNDDIMISMKLPFLLYLPSFKHLKQLYIPKEIFILLHRDFTLQFT